MKMDMWKYFGITHTDHTVMNPMSLAKTGELIERLHLPDSSRVLDVACGKAEFLCLVAERYEVGGTGLDLSPITIEEARKNVAARGLKKRIELLHMKGSKYEPDVKSRLNWSTSSRPNWSKFRMTVGSNSCMTVDQVLGTWHGPNASRYYVGLCGG